VLSEDLNDNFASVINLFNASSENWLKSAVLMGFSIGVNKSSSSFFFFLSFACLINSVFSCVYIL